jgi:hypothetical protein
VPTNHIPRYTSERRPKKQAALPSTRNQTGIAMYKSILSVCLLAVVLTTSQGCMVLSSDGVTKRQPTIGQQLIDLKAALDKGAITPDEYEHQKAELLRHPS